MSLKKKLGLERHASVSFNSNIIIIIMTLPIITPITPLWLRKDCGFSCDLHSLGYTSIVKGKAVPLQAWTGPEGSRKLRFPDFMTTAQDGGKVVSLTHRPPLPPGNTPGTHFC